MKANILAVFLAAMSSVSAATVTFEIILDEVDSSYTSTTLNLGEVTYDESKLTGVGEETLKVADASMTLVFDDETYTEASDGEYPNFPEFYFTDGEFVGVSFETTLTSTSAFSSSYLLIDKTNVFYSFDGTQEFAAHMELGADLVPEPSSSALIGAALILLSFSRRRKQS